MEAIETLLDGWAVVLSRYAAGRPGVFAAGEQ
jgi:hypothetical protein